MESGHLDLTIIERIHSQLDRIEATVDNVRPELIAIRTDLNYHIHRTNVLEAQVMRMDKDVTKFRGFFAIGGWLIGIAATILTLLNSLGII